MKALSPKERAFINQFQGGFPIVGRPFHSVAAKLGMTETALIQFIERLLDDGLLSRFGPLYDATRLGGRVTLAAISVPEAEFDRVAQLVNAQPAVAHNYRREHALNMWFVVTSGRQQGVDECLSTISRQSGLPVYDFPKRREFFLGLWLNIDRRGRVRTVSPPPAMPSFATETSVPDGDLQRVVMATQAGLPLVAEPYAQLADELGMSSEECMDLLRRMQSGGVIRRIGAVPNHYALGLRGNGMTVWDVPGDSVAELGERIGRLDFVSHCYERPRHPDVWRYNLFAMVHGHNRDEVLEKTAALRRILGNSVRAHDVLFSSALLKKTGLRLAA